MTLGAYNLLFLGVGSLPRAHPFLLLDIRVSSSSSLMFPEMLAWRGKFWRTSSLGGEMLRHSLFRIYFDLKYVKSEKKRRCMTFPVTRSLISECVDSSSWVNGWSDEFIWAFSFSWKLFLPTHLQVRIYIKIATRTKSEHLVQNCAIIISNWIPMIQLELDSTLSQSRIKFWIWIFNF